MQVVRVTPASLTPAVIDEAVVLLGELVRGGAALGWVDPPTRSEVSDLLHRVVDEVPAGDAALALAWSDGALAGLGYWRRYARPTHRPHADLEKLAVGGAHQGLGVGRLLMTELIGAAVDAGIEILTLDLRGDNVRAARLYEALGFVRYGVLEGFVAVGEARFATIFMALHLRPAGPG